MKIRKHPNLDFWCDEEGNVYDRNGNIKTYKPQKRYNKIHVVLKGGGRKTIDLHRLVVETWLGEIPKGMQVNHIDGNRQNNSVRNLEICTPSQNTQHAFDNKLIVPYKGEEHYASTLSDEQVIQIYNHIRKLYNNQEIADIFNVEFKLVSLLRNGKRWKHLFEEHLGEVIPAIGGHLGRDVTVPMLYLSYFTDKPNYKIAEALGVDRSNISNVRLGKSYKWASKNKNIIKEVYEQDFKNGEQK